MALYRAMGILLNRLVDTFRGVGRMGETQGPAPKMVVRDSDTKFGPVFDRVLRTRGVRPMKLPHCSPSLNAHPERFVQTVRVECLDRFIVPGTRHLDYLVGEYVEHSNGERPHSGLGHRIPGGPAPPVVGTRTEPVVCRTQLGGCVAVAPEGGVAKENGA